VPNAPDHILVVDQRNVTQCSRFSGWGAAPLAGVLLHLSPTVAPWRVRQSLPFTHMLDLPGRGAKDIQLLVVTAHRGMCAGLVLLPLDHGRPYRKSRARVLICINAMMACARGVPTSARTVSVVVGGGVRAGRAGP
jgi:hypothetical protein